MRDFLFITSAILIGAFVILIWGLLFIVPRNLIRRRPILTDVGAWSAYPLIGFFLTAALMGVIFFEKSQGLKGHETLKWLYILVIAVFVFGGAAKEYWASRDRWTFWVTLIVLVAVHFVLLSRLDLGRSGYSWFVGFVWVPESIAVSSLFEWMFRRAGLKDSVPGHSDSDQLR